MAALTNMTKGPKKLSTMFPPGAPAFLTGKPSDVARDPKREAALAGMIEQVRAKRQAEKENK